MFSCQHHSTFCVALSMHKNIMKIEKAQKSKTKPGESENDHLVVESVASSKLILNKKKNSKNNAHKGI